MSSQAVSPVEITIPLKKLVQSSFTTTKVINYKPSSRYRGTPRCLGLSSDGRYLACGDDLGRLEVFFISLHHTIAGPINVGYLDSRDSRVMACCSNVQCGRQNHLHSVASYIPKNPIFLLQVRECSYNSAGR